MVSSVILAAIILAAATGNGQTGIGARADANQAASRPAATQPASRPSAERVAQWIVELGDKDFARREKAQQALIAVGRRAVPLLEAAAKDRDPERANRAEECLRQIKDRQVRIIPLTNVDADIARETLEKSFGKDGETLRIAVHAPGNAVVLAGNAQTLAEAQKLVRELDAGPARRGPPKDVSSRPAATQPASRPAEGGKREMHFERSDATGKAAMLREIFTRIGAKATVDANGSTVRIEGDAMAIGTVDSVMVPAVAHGLQVNVFELKRGDAEAMCNVLRKILNRPDDELVHAFASPQTDSIVVAAETSDMRVVRSVIMAMDSVLDDVAGKKAGRP
jgi:type II secretory pathway component GspD/PulD (secretin)